MYKYIYPSIIMLRTCFFVFRFPAYPSRPVRKIYDYQCVTIVVLLTINVLRFKMRAYIKKKMFSLHPSPAHPFMAPANSTLFHGVVQDSSDFILEKTALAKDTILIKTS